MGFGYFGDNDSLVYYFYYYGNFVSCRYSDY